jgi:hypothetical protein
VSYRVRVVQQRSRALSGVADCRYVSPQQEAGQARDLLRVLLGYDPECDRTRWQLPIAGGIMSIDLLNENDDDHG